MEAAKDKNMGDNTHTALPKEPFTLSYPNVNLLEHGDEFQIKDRFGDVIVKVPVKRDDLQATENLAKYLTERLSGKVTNHDLLVSLLNEVQPILAGAACSSKASEKYSDMVFNLSVRIDEAIKGSTI